RLRARPAGLAAVDVAPPARRRGSHAFHRAVGLFGAHRLRGTGGTQACDPRAGAVRSRPPSQHRGGTGAARGRAVVAGPSAGASDARSAQLLARQLRGGQSRNEGPLPAPSLARQSALCRAHAPRQAALVLMLTFSGVLRISMPGGGGSANWRSGDSMSHGAAARATVITIGYPLVGADTVPSGIRNCFRDPFPASPGRLARNVPSGWRARPGPPGAGRGRNRPRSTCPRTQYRSG